MINELIKKLRKAADVLDDLMDSIPSNNHKAVESILKSKPKQKRVYTKPHWTQLPKNKEKVKLLGIKAAKTKKLNHEKT